MLVLTRQQDESVVFDFSQLTDDELQALRTAAIPVRVMVAEVRGAKVRLAFAAPKAVKVHREEVYTAIQQENRSANHCLRAPH